MMLNLMVAFVSLTLNCSNSYAFFTTDALNQNLTTEIKDDPTKFILNQFSPQDQLLSSKSAKSLPVVVPNRAIEMFKKHPYWLTFRYFEIPVGNTSLTFGISNKVWDRKIVDESVVLKERLKLTPRKSANGTVEWGQSRVTLPEEALDLNIFSVINLTNQLAPSSHLENYSFTYYDQERFILKNGFSDKTNVNIIFMPIGKDELISSFGRTHIYAKNGVMTAPLGSLDDLAEANLPGKKPSSYLHHNITSKKLVYINNKFPTPFILNLRRVLGRWNAAFGTNYFVYKGRTQNMNYDWCIMNNFLCIEWKGGDKIAWAGLGGLANFNFNPESGIIRGGLITFDARTRTDLALSSPYLIEKLTSDVVDKNWVASSFLSRSFYSQIEHPFPGLVVENFLLHELGHYNGYTHNFEGNNLGQFQTVMDYDPFPLSARNTELGDWDFDKIDLVYRDSALPTSYSFCSQKQSVPQFVEGIWRKKAECNTWDYGEPSGWYILLAELSQEGFMSELPYFMPPEKFPTKILSAVGFFLIDSETSKKEYEKIIGALCEAQNLKLVTDFLQEHFGYHLLCSERGKLF